jgi:hypothetical protein
VDHAGRLTDRDVFVSYCRADEKIAVLVTDHLKVDLHLRAWLDIDEMVPGTPWRPQVLDGIKSSRMVLLIASQFAMASGDVEWECKTARELGLPVVCCRIDDDRRNRPFDVDSEIDLRRDPLDLDGWTAAVSGAPYSVSAGAPCLPEAIAVRRRFLRTGLSRAWLGAILLTLVYAPLARLLGRPITADEIRGVVVAGSVLVVVTHVAAAIHWWHVGRRRARLWWLGRVLAAVPYLWMVSVGVSLVVLPFEWGRDQATPFGPLFRFMLAYPMMLVIVLMVALVGVSNSARWIICNTGVAGRVVATAARGVREVVSRVLVEPFCAVVFTPIGDDDYVKRWLPAFLRRRRKVARVSARRHTHLSSISQSGWRVTYDPIDEPFAHWVLETAVAAAPHDDSRREFVIASARSLRDPQIGEFTQGAIVVTVDKPTSWMRNSTHQLVDASHLQLDAIAKQLTAAANGEAVRMLAIDPRRRFLGLPRQAAVRGGIAFAVGFLIAITRFVANDDTFGVASAPGAVLLPVAVVAVYARRAPLALVGWAFWALMALVVASLFDPELRVAEATRFGSAFAVVFIVGIPVALAWGAVRRGVRPQRWFVPDGSIIAIKGPVQLRWLGLIALLAAAQIYGFTMN